MNCNYRYCGDTIPLNENGNRRYCNDECYMAEKLERSKDNYEANKKSLNKIKHIEKILRAAYNKYGNEIITANILRAEGIDWTFITGTTVIESIKYRVVGSYGYASYLNDTVKIIKL